MLFISISERRKSVCWVRRRKGRGRRQTALGFTCLHSSLYSFFPAGSSAGKGKGSEDHLSSFPSTVPVCTCFSFPHQTDWMFLYSGEAVCVTIYGLVSSVQTELQSCRCLMGRQSVALRWCSKYLLHGWDVTNNGVDLRSVEKRFPKWVSHGYCPWKSHSIIKKEKYEVVTALRQSSVTSPS